MLRIAAAVEHTCGLAVDQSHTHINRRPVLIRKGRTPSKDDDAANSSEARLARAQPVTAICRRGAPSGSSEGMSRSAPLNHLVSLLTD